MLNTCVVGQFGVNYGKAMVEDDFNQYVWWANQQPSRNFDVDYHLSQPKSCIKSPEETTGSGTNNVSDRSSVCYSSIHRPTNSADDVDSL
jgi:hypothetical protein